MLVLFHWDVPAPLRAHLRERLGSMDLAFDDDDAVPKAQVIVGWKLDDALLDRAERCAVCINPGAGVDLLLELFRGREKPPVLANGHGNARLTAQGGLALLLALTNRVALHDRQMRLGVWRDDVFAGRFESAPLFGRAVRVLGMGHVGRAFAELLAPFDVELRPVRRGQALGTRPGEILIVSAPLTEETRGLVDERAIERLGPDGLIVNLARGPIVDEEALFAALRTGALGGAALDVWYEYKPVADDVGRRYASRFAFHELDNVVLSPHRAASPFADLGRWDDVIDNLQRFARGDVLQNVVDLERGY